MARTDPAAVVVCDAGPLIHLEELGFEVHGTIGVIVRALRRGLRTKRRVLNLLRSIPQRSTLFIGARLLDSVINEVVNASEPER